MVEAPAAAPIAAEESAPPAAAPEPTKEKQETEKQETAPPSTTAAPTTAPSTSTSTATTLDATPAAAAAAAAAAPAAAVAAAPTPEPYLRGTLAHDASSGRIVVKGKWAFSRALFDGGDAKDISSFEFRSLEPDAAAAAAAGAGPSGDDAATATLAALLADKQFHGWIGLKLHPKQAASKIAEHAMTLSATDEGDAGGKLTLTCKGYNVFGHFVIKGHAWPSATAPPSSTTRTFEVECYKTYTGEACPPNTVKDWKEPKRLDEHDEIEPKAAKGHT